MEDVIVTMGKVHDEERRRPRELRIVVALTLTNLVRLVGFGLAAAALGGQAPRSGVFGGVGDGIAALAALVVAVALLRRPGFGSWVGAIAWNVYALTDVVFANAINTFSPDARPFPAAVYLLPLYFAATHVVSLALLNGPRLRLLALVAPSRSKRAQAARGIATPSQRTVSDPT